jgi:hypothetical protein
MAAVPIEIMPPSWHRYPLPSHTNGSGVPHDYVGCGEPDWCLHDTPPADVEYAAEPIVFNGPESMKINPELSEYLADIGFDEHTTKGLAINFREDLKGTMIAGYHDGMPYLDGIGKDTMTFHPKAVHVQAGMSPRATNQTLWHELGHVYSHQIGGTERLAQTFDYHNKATIARTKKLGKIAVGVGYAESITAGILDATGIIDSAPATPLMIAAGSALVIGGLYAATQPRKALWLASREEIRAERFAFKHRKMPILIDKNA